MSALRVLVLASQKGGCGKSTLALNLAVVASYAGIGPIAMVDTDPQATLTRWWRKREAETPALSSTPITNLATKIRSLDNGGYALCIIDTPPAITSNIRAVIECADLVLIPVQPSPADLWAVGETIDLAKEAKRDFAFALTRIVRGTTMARSAAGALAIHGEVAGTMVNRVSYGESLLTGQSVHELEPRGSAAKEISAFWDFVSSRLLDSQKAKVKVTI
jgi:chromosome partitioning protein